MRGWTRRDALWGGVALATVGCMPKTPPLTASSPMKVVLAGVLAGKKAKVRALPEGVQRRLEKALSARKLTPSVLAMDALKEPLSKRRETPQRLAWLADNAGGAEAMMLVELEAFYDTQIQGRMRWTVRGTVSIGEVGAPGAALQRSVDTAVFLQFLHQAEAEAATEAATTIERAANRLLDDWLRVDG